MGIVRPDQCERLEIEEFSRMLLSCAAVYKTKALDDFRGRDVATKLGNDDVLEGKLVCVTGGVSFLGLAVVNSLLIRGYPVRIIVSDQEDLEKLRETELSGEMIGANKNVEVIMAQLSEIEDLAVAFEGCYGVFHTADFVDPAGLSGYSKSMVHVEVKTTENVMEACGRTSSVRRCVLTSSLLACIWQDRSQNDLPSLINEDCWSDEALCIDKKLWYALGKLRAEKAAWRVADERGLKMVSICPGLITGPEFCGRNSTATIAYLKGAQQMYGDGLLATVDVNRLAEAHVCVFDAMNKTAFGRYICFDRVIGREEELEKLVQETGIQINRISGDSSSNFPSRFELSNTKLSKLMSRSLQCHDQC